MSSISSQLIGHITYFRNPDGREEEWTRRPHTPPNPLKVALAEIGYLATIPFAIIETALSAIAKLFSLCLPLSRESHEAMSRWVGSSAFSIAWTSCDAVLNLFTSNLIVSENVARACAASGDLFAIPAEALRNRGN